MAGLRDVREANVRAVFEAYPSEIRAALLGLRGLILDTAAQTEGVGDVVETLKWGQPSYLPARPRIGTTIRIDRDTSVSDAYAMFVHCQSGLIDTYRDLYPDTFSFAGNRGLVFRTGASLPRRELAHCIALALTLHLRRRGGRR